MKRFILALASFITIVACNKSTTSQPQNSSLVGKWKLSESYSDPGDGSSTWHIADPSKPSYLEFKNDGSLSNTPNNMFNADHYRVTSDSTIVFISVSQEFEVRYTFTKTLLSLYPPCIEGCGLKYVPSI